MNKSLVIMSMIGVAMFACASTGSMGEGKNVLASEYAPLAVGSSWTYNVEYPGQKGEMKVELVSFKDGYFLDNRKGTLQHTLSGLRDRERYLIRHPIKVGTAWKSVTGPSAVEHLRIDEVGVPCESHAGRFTDCLIVNGRLRRDKNMQLHIKWVWAKGVGLVRVETEAEITGKGRVPQVKQSLKDYSVGGQKKEGPATRVKPESGADDDGPNTWTTQ